MRSESPASGVGHLVASALARRMVRGYPQPWRDRYEGEMMALLDDSPARLRDVIDLARGLVIERVRSMFEPGDRPTLSTVLVSMERPARAIVVLGLAALAGLAVRHWVGPAPRPAGVLGMLMSTIVMLTSIIGMIRSFSPTLVPFEPPEPFFAQPVVRVWTGLALAAAFMLSWASASYSFYMPQAIVLSMMWKPRPWHAVMARALYDLRHAGTYRKREEARATLHGLGYRATLRTPAR